MVGKENVLSSKEDLICYSYDATNLEALPDLVVFPKETKEISEILILANKSGFPVIPRGAGTGFTGGSLPVQGGVVLAMTRMNRVIEIDMENLSPLSDGVITGDSEASQGWTLPSPDPAWHSVFHSERNV
jgi:glycolate oxidase